MTIKASARMRAHWQDLDNSGRLGENMSFETRSVEERVRESRARLAIQGAPLLYKQRRPEPKDWEPTPERRRHADETLEKISIKAKGENSSEVVKGYRVRPFMVQHGNAFPPEVQNAIARFLQDSEYHLRVRVSDLNTSGGGSSGARLGGLGEVAQYERDGHNRHVWLERQLRGNAVFSQVLEKLLYRTQERPDGKPFNLEDFGRLLWPALNDVNALRYSTKTAVMAFGAELLKLYKHPACPKVTWIDHNERQAESERQSVPDHPWHTQIEADQ